MYANYLMIDLHLRNKHIDLRFNRHDYQIL
jgi:hypothetical protein